MFLKGTLTLLLSLMSGMSLCLASEKLELNQRNLGPQVRLTALLRSELAKKWPNSTIQFMGPIRWTGQDGDSKNFEKVSIQQITPKGEAEFTAVESATGSAHNGWVNYAAWVDAWVPVRRVFPGDRITKDAMTTQEINVASGNAYEYRGLILGRETPIEGLEARQTLLQGNFLVSTAVQRIPDIRRGEAVRIRLISGGLAVSTGGIAEEPGYFDSKIRVMSSKTKKEFFGVLEAGGVVEVKL